MSITHVTVAADPQTPKLTDTDWNAPHSNPTLAEVLVAGNDVGGTVITSTDGNGITLRAHRPTPNETPAALALGDNSGGDAFLTAGDGTPNSPGGNVELTGGYGNDGSSGPGDLRLHGGGSDGVGGAVLLVAGDAEGGTNTAGGDVTIHGGAGDGAGRNGLVFLNLPTSDPGVSGALYVLAGVVMVS
jgi:hypothetical protein